MKHRIRRNTKSPFARLRLFVFRLLLLSTLALFLSGCVRRSRDASLSKESITPPLASPATVGQEANELQSGILPHEVNSANQATAHRININTAPAGEIEKLPGIGKGLAQRIIEQREKYGRFRRPEYLIAVRGISDRRFRAIRDLISVY